LSASQGLAYRRAMQERATQNQEIRSRLVALEDLKALQPANGRLMGLDLGTKTIGIAYCDTLLSVATPRETLRRRKFTADAKELIKRAEQEHIFAIVMGLPLNMDASEGPRVQATRAFVRNFAPLSPLPFVLWDERLSTHTAKDAMIASGVSKGKLSQKIDAVAASIILQDALDRLNARATPFPAGD